MTKWKVKLRCPIWIITKEGIINKNRQDGYKFLEEIIELPDMEGLSKSSDLINKRIEWAYQSGGFYELWTIVEAERHNGD